MATTKKKITSKKKASPKKAASKKIAKAKVVKKKVIVRKTAPAKRTSAKQAVKRPVKSVAVKKTASKAKTSKSIAPVVQNAYSPQIIEKKWQAKWQKDQLYRSVIDHSRPKHYALTMLPYPSGDLHIGHWFSMIPPDTRARYMRMKGYNVLFPMGFDAFGLPAENAAIKDGVHPMKRTFQNIERMRTQMKTMGTMFDWERQAVSADPEYYKWTEWFFIQLYKMGLAYRKMSAVDWCPHCNTTLAREQVWGDDRHCERCGTPVIKKNLEQWFFRATKYADELLRFDEIDWPERVKTLQTNWIGRSEGASVIFKISPLLASPISKGNGGGEEGVEIFTTRPDTLWGATFMVFAPEHSLVEKVTTPEQREAVNAYKTQSARQ